MICNCCGKEISDDSLYCSYCGTKFEQLKNDKSKFCPNCNMPYEDDDEFCRYCGFTLKASDYKNFEKTNVEINKAAKIKKIGLIVSVVFLIVMIVVTQTFAYINYRNIKKKYNEKNYYEALTSLNNADTHFGIFNFFKKRLEEQCVSSLYDQLVEHYQNGCGISSYEKAEEFKYLFDNFEYRDSYNYYILCRSDTSILRTKKETEQCIKWLKNNLNFDNAKDVAVSKNSIAKGFLEGSWKNNSNDYYFTLDSSGTTYYNLPHFEASGSYIILNGIFMVGDNLCTYETITVGGPKNQNATKQFKFTVIDVNTISVYCYRTGITYILCRE